MGWTVDLSQFASSYRQMLATMTVHNEMICAVRCLRAEGIKTALLTNNFNLPNTQIPRPLQEVGLFDVVSNDHLDHPVFVVDI